MAAEEPTTEVSEERKERLKRQIKLGILIAVAGVGTYYGVTRPLKGIRKDVKALNNDLKTFNDSVVDIGKFMANEALDREDMLNTQRSAITDALMKDKGFTFYPGLGVLHHDAVEAAKNAAKEL